jgi:intein/homing endonuclease
MPVTMGVGHEDWDNMDLDLTEKMGKSEEYEQEERSLSLGVLCSTPSDFTQFAIMMPDKKVNDVVPFSFKGREYLFRCYDTPSRRTLFKFGRQAEKCQPITTEIIRGNGHSIALAELQVGDTISSLSSWDKATPAQVSWKSEKILKPCLRIHTRKGEVVEAGLEHPFLTLLAWKESQTLRVGDRVGTIRRAGTFGVSEIPDDLIAFCGYMIGDGHCGRNSFGFTQLPDSPVYQEFLDICERRNWRTRLRGTKSRAASIYLRSHQKESEPRRLLETWNLWGHNSGTKFAPPWVFDLTKEKTALFLNRLWSTDGSILYREGVCKYELTYSSISLQLIRDIQHLLWKFGIPTGVRKYIPELYKGTDKVAYVLRVLTREGIRVFLSEIGALGKSEGIPLPDSEIEENNNQDTLPIEINKLIFEILISHPTPGSLQGCRATRSLSKFGLSRTLKYAPTRGKVLRYVEFFRGDPGFSKTLVDELESHATSDIFWDEITSIEDIGEQWCYDISVGETENFIAQGFITHNSTMLGNKCLAFMALVPNITVLYVSPTQTQTKTFSVDRIAEPLRLSSILRSFTTEQQISNVFHKKFLNGAEIKLRNAYLNADRVRGIASDFILIDEIQDILADSVPVIEESASHSAFKLFSYSGTPKTIDNPLEFYWGNRSTQNEWVVPCRKHGLPGQPSTWYWNVLSEENIGLKGLICDKCGGTISAADPEAQWVSMNPHPKVNGVEIVEPFEGFHIAQIMVPWMQSEKEWNGILYKQATYSRTKFYNEVLGLSFDSGSRPVTQADMIKNCGEDPYGFTPGQAGIKYMRELSQRINGGSKFFVGIDWGGGSESSFTSISVGCYMEPHNRFTYVYGHRYAGPESEPSVRMQLIQELLDTVKFDLAFVDYGGGFDPNDALVRKYGRKKIYKCQYSTPSEIIKWDNGLDRFMLHRSEIMSSYFSAIKRGNTFRFPAWSVYENPYAQDHLNIYSEYNERTRMEEYNHSPSSPDDTCHSNIYAFLASTLRTPRRDVFTPTGGTQSNPI